MAYYKIIRNGTITDVIENPTFVREFRGRNILADASDAMGLVSSDGAVTYHIYGQPEFTNKQYETVSVADISKEEYDELTVLLELGGKVSDEDSTVDWVNEKIPEENLEEEIKNQALEETKKRKIEQLSEQCHAVIENGIDVELSDGQVKHFGLKLEDQLNYMTFASMIAAGHPMIPYHASGELCEYYSAEDIGRVIEAATAYKTYHTSYFNSLRNWIYNMKTVVEIGTVKYGDVIPAEYCSDVLIDISEVIE